MNLYLPGWNGPLLVPSTSGINNAYKALSTSGVPLDKIQAALPGCAVSRKDFRTADEYHYFWGVHIQLNPGIEVALLLPWARDARPVTMHVRGEIATAVLEYVISTVQACFEALIEALTPPEKVVHIRLPP